MSDELNYPASAGGIEWWTLKETVHRNFKFPPFTEGRMSNSQRYPKPLIWSIIQKNVDFQVWKVFNSNNFSIVSEARNLKPENRTTIYIMCILRFFKGTVVNPFNWWLLETMFTLSNPFKMQKFFQNAQKFKEKIKGQFRQSWFLTLFQPQINIFFLNIYFLLTCS